MRNLLTRKKKIAGNRTTVIAFGGLFSGRVAAWLTFSPQSLDAVSLKDKAASAQPSAPRDPLGRETPKGFIHGLLEAMADQD